MIIGIDATQSFTQYGMLSSKGIDYRRIDNHDRIEDLPLLFNELITTSDDSIQSVLTIIGPGSYTGIRLSLTSAKMLAKVHQASIRWVPLFDAYMHVISPLVQSLCIVTSNSRKGFLNVQLFQSNQDGVAPVSSLLQQTDAQFMAFLNKFEAPIGWHHIGDQCRFAFDLPDTVQKIAADLALDKVLAVVNSDPNLWASENNSSNQLIYSAPAVV